LQRHSFTSLHMIVYRIVSVKFNSASDGSVHVSYVYVYVYVSLWQSEKLELSSKSGILIHDPSSCRRSLGPLL
jgi:hypothetical protein